MASSPNTEVTFATLPREVRDNIYEHMLPKSKTIDTVQRADYGQPEDFGTLRATLHACPKAPQYAREAFEAFFRINIFRIHAKHDLGFLNRPVYYVKGQDFQPMRVFVKEVEIKLIIGTREGNCGLDDCYRSPLACPILRRVTVKVGLSRDTHEKSSDVTEDTVLNERESEVLAIIFTATAGMYHQELKAKIGPGLKFETRHLRIGEYMKAWEEGIGKARVK